jgi:hypothetical protein
MNRSTEIDKLAEALAKAQHEMKAPTKNKTARIATKAGGAYTYKYSDLADTIEAAKPLSANGLSCSQIINMAPTLHLEAVLMHSSGQWISSVYPLTHSGTPQEFGSQLTYARRYLISCLLGIAADEDDDGAGASNNGNKGKTERQAPPPPVIAEDHKPEQHATTTEQKPPQPSKPTTQAMSRNEALAALKAKGALINTLMGQLPAALAADLSAAKSAVKPIHDNPQATIAELIRAGDDLKAAIEKAEAQLQPA